MRPRERLRMTAEEVAAFLAECSKCQFASLDADGTPHVVPVNYVPWGDGGIAFWADPGSQKVVNARRDRRVTCLVERGSRVRDYQGVQIKGEAEVVEDQAVVQAIGAAFLERVPPDRRTDRVVAATEELGRQRIAVVVTPRRVISWDHTKAPDMRPADVGR